MNTASEGNVTLTIGLIFALLSIASAFIYWLNKQNPEKDYSELIARTRSWWIMIGLFSAAVLLGSTTTVIFFGFVSFLGLKEFFSMVPTRRADRRVLFWCYLSIIFQYLWVSQSWYGMFIIFIPVYMFLLIPIRMLFLSETDGFLRSASTIQWGLMITVFGLSHAALLTTVQHSETGLEGYGAALLLYLIFLTQFNDVAQYVWGKSFGKHKIAPSVSPNKTFEGFIGGAITTMVLAAIIAPWLTPLSLVHSIAAGLIISVGGFIGDLNISAIKRDMGVKDSSSLIPGHGGVLDRVDSLSFTAPLFFHFIYFFYY